MIEVTPEDRRSIAAALGLSEQYVYQVTSQRGKLAPERCPAAERATAGRIPVEWLRPDVSWTRVPDLDWPHPAGRPLIDAAQDAR